MSQATLADRPYVNSNLFSGHYLDERLQDRDEWDCDEAASEAMADLQALYELEGELVTGYSEDALIDNWIDEVLDTLGFGTQVEVSLPGRGGFVDELLFENSERRRNAAKVYLDSEDTRDLFERGVGLVEAKQWDADFTARFSEQRPYRNASHQIKHYLENTPENIQWGVLTNGRKWRLYGTKNYETQTYFEVDLPELLERGDLEAFKYFYVFFRPGAFHESGGTTFLDEVWSESETASQELGEDLQDNVFTAVRVLGKGFVETNDSLDIDPGDEEALGELKEQSLVLLYRLMFVLYAESRGLIHPEGQAAQDDYENNFSLDELRIEIHDAIGEVDDGFEDEFSTYSTSMWSRLEDLFRLIDQGEEDLGIPPYNGGLFNHDEHEFLTENEVSNRYLAEVIYRLSTAQNDEGRYVLADYADLDTRHLGSVYEGLLEHQFRIAPEQYAAVAEDGGQVWKPATEVSVADAVETVDEGGLYVVNDEGERKATGSYYTPDYVVTYIVEETVGPLVEEIREDLIEQGFEPGTQEYIGPFFRRVTDLRILDPAMGSGHFLTKATGYLSEQVMSEVREAESEFGVAFDERHVRREITKECIYGVDLNGMAVELAKLSMWLETLAADRPLAFLDHHFKQGNSLVGSDIEDVLDNGDDADAEDGQLTLQQSFEHTRQRALEHVMERFQELLSIENESLEDVKEMEAAFDEVQDDPLYRHLLSMANVHTAEAFGLSVPGDAYERMAEALRGESWADIEGQDWFEDAQAIADEQRFFHWELEFPVAFYGGDGEKLEDAGFDAVIGNPPYIRMEKFKDLKNYLRGAYETHASRSDMYVYFVERSIEVLQPNGEYGAIISNKFLRANYGRGLRQFLSRNVSIKNMIDFGELPVFDDASVMPLILLGTTGSYPEHPRYAEIHALDFDTLFRRVDQRAYQCDPDAISGPDWRVAPRHVSDLMDKLDQRGQPLGDVVNDQILRGIVTGLNEAFLIDGEVRDQLIDQDTRSKEVINPLVRGDDMERYRIKNREQWILYIDHGTDIDSYPAVKEYLSQYRPDLEDRATEQEWYELQQPQSAYRGHFDEPKILYPEIALEPRFAYHDGPLYPNNKCFFIPQENHELLAILNSNVTHFYLAQTCSTLGNPRDRGRIEFRAQYLTNLPIPSRLEEIETEAGDGLSNLAKKISDLKQRRASLNLNLRNYLGNYADGPKLPDIGLFQPTSSNVLGGTAEDYENLRIGDARTERDGSSVTISATARYKPSDGEEHETDRWGYTETGYLEAFTLTDLTDKEAALVEAFVPVAVDEAGGFANFRETATKTNSLVDRLEALTLPDPDDVADGLERYIDAKERAEELDAKIERTDELIDEIVYELYGLTDEEIEIVEEAVAE
ncbi:Eco57I restriction-modification methylase domain-containing protein [Halobellus salinisoli]|uniref:Eco57I restriction-modification methylase domain-containing protein n=1 Tax=Halobellus salinisoli TaxID=3108500 RepID=UPI003008547C